MIRLTAVIEVEGQAPRALTYESNAKTITIGRDASNDFQLPLATVSRQHARISEDDGLYTLQDLGSTHGTKLGDKVLSPQQTSVLRHGDIIELTQAKITCAVEQEKVASTDPHEGTQASANRAVQGILGRLGEAKGEPYLRILGGTHDGKRYELGAGLSTWTLGRSAECELVIEDANVSRRHAILRRDWQGYTISDLGSKNGVLVGDKRIRRPRRLRNEDEVTIGPVRLVFVDPDADLLDALKGVPGFEVEQSVDVDAAADEDDEANLSQTPQLSAVDGRRTGLPDQEAQTDESPDDLAELDPSLLEPLGGRAVLDWALLGGAILVAVLAIVGLWMVLS